MRTNYSTVNDYVYWACLSVCLSVCLTVCQRDNSSSQQIRMKCLNSF